MIAWTTTAVGQVTTPGQCVGPRCADPAPAVTALQGNIRLSTENPQIIDPGTPVGPGSVATAASPAARAPSAAAAPVEAGMTHSDGLKSLPPGAAHSQAKGTLIVVVGTEIGPGSTPPFVLLGHGRDPNIIVVPGTGAGPGASLISPAPPVGPTAGATPSFSPLGAATSQGGASASPAGADVRSLLRDFAAALERQSLSLERAPPATPAGGVQPTAAATSPAFPSAGRLSKAGVPYGGSPLSFDSGLRDCEIPFDELPARAPSCTAAVAPPGRRCEAYSRSQFTEVVSLLRYSEVHNAWVPHCTGTLVSTQWVVTAAHCLIGQRSAAAMTGGSGSDYRVPAEELKSHRVIADNVMTLDGEERERTIGEAIVYGRYGGFGPRNGIYFDDDLALLRLASPLPAEVVEPARIATGEQLNAAATLAGFGISNVDGGTLGRFNATWPVPLQQVGGELKFVPGVGSEHKSAFCQGDSGGPVLAGRNRGCRRTDIVRELRPRYLQGVVSSNERIALAPGSPAASEAAACMAATMMTMQDVTTRERRRWLCETTIREAGGC